MTRTRHTRMRSISASLIVSVTATLFVGCAPSTPLDSDGVLAAHLRADEPGCSAAVAREGVVQWAGARGVADIESGASLTTASVFDMASVSKQFTAVAVLLLVDDGVLSLDDSVTQWVDGLPADARAVDLNALLHHTSGITDYTGLLDAELSDVTTQRDALDVIAAQDPFRGGDGFEYSNSNYVLLAEVVSTASGMPLADFLEQRIFAPLELTMTLDPIYDGADRALSYESNTEVEANWLQVGDGAIHSTPTQLVLWADNYRTGAVGGANLLAAQTAGAVDTGYGSNYGAGIEIAHDGSLSHLGGWAGYVTLFGISADRSTAIAVMCNSVDADAGAIATGLQAIWAP